MIAQLIPLDGSNPVAITRNLTIVGRKRGLCDLILDSSSVSKVHCAIAKTDGLLFIRDLGSTNGTKVNGQRVSRGALLPGDEIAFANIRYRVHLGPGEGPDDDRTERLMAMPHSSEDLSEGEMVEGELVQDRAHPLSEDALGNAKLVGVDSEGDLPLISDD